MILRIALLLVALLLPGMLNGAAWSQDYPNRRISLIVPFPAGSGPDVYARIIGEKLSQRLGQPVIIENRPGGGGSIGSRSVAKADPDGYTLLFGSTGSVLISPAVAKEAPFDPATAFAPIVQVLRGPFFLSVRSDLPIQTLAELIDYAKKNPGKLNYGTSGPGSLHHLSTEMLKQVAGIDMVHIPYPGGAQSWTALRSGIVDLIFDSMPGPIATLQAGKARALAVTGPKRLADLPGVALSRVPTFEEQGIKGVDVEFWFGILAPSGTPKPIVDKLNAELTAVINEPDVKARFAQQSLEVAAGPADAFDRFIAKEAGRWQRLVDSTGIKQK
jgi:tripartite-type tricarboxylate transporter receptor subunit TctC